MRVPAWLLTEYFWAVTNVYGLFMPPGVASGLSHTAKIVGYTPYAPCGVSVIGETNSRSAP